MDMVMVDVTEIPGTAVGDEAVLIGRQGNERNYGLRDCQVDGYDSLRSPVRDRPADS